MIGMVASAATATLSPVVLVAAVVAVVGLALGVVALVLDPGSTTLQARPAQRLVRREHEIAVNLGWPVRTWIAARGAALAGGLAAGALTQIPLLVPVAGAAGFAGLRWAVAGRAATRRLRNENAFLGQLRILRDRMAVSNQSLDTALQEIGRDAPRELRWILAPLARGGSMIGAIVEVGTRAGSPVVEHACAVLILARNRSVDSLIEVIDDVLLDVGASQLALEEESLVTLGQQRAVTIAMSGLLVVVFAAVTRVDAFRGYYQTFTGQVFLAAALVVFGGLVAAVGRIVRVPSWSRWDLRRLAAEQERLGG